MYCRREEVTPPIVPRARDPCRHRPRVLSSLSLSHTPLYNTPKTTNGAASIRRWPPLCYTTFKSSDMNNESLVARNFSSDPDSYTGRTGRHKFRTASTLWLFQLYLFRHDRQSVTRYAVHLRRPTTFTTQPSKFIRDLHFLLQALIPVARATSSCLDS